jgi:hypothetical protein
MKENWRVEEDEGKRRDDKKERGRRKGASDNNMENMEKVEQS